MKRTYYSMEHKDDAAVISIYGDITSYPWIEGDVSAVNLSKQLEKLNGVKEISVYINSYGGEVAEGLAIYNSLKRHKARVKTYCDGFAASIASVIFMAGDERIMNDSSLLMIHNAWSFAEGNAEELRKLADDLDKITQASVTAYKAHSNLSEEEIKALMDGETWILPEEAVSYGFATGIEKTVSERASQNARRSLFDIVRMALDDENDSEEEPEDEEVDDTEETDEPEEAPEDEEDTTDNEPPTDDEQDEENPDDEQDEDEATQFLRGFFNALTK